jgi:WD repeat-containing protein 68
MAEPPKSEMYSYKAPWPIYGLGWSQKKEKPFRLAIGSFIEEYTNKVSGRCVC